MAPRRLGATDLEVTPICAGSAVLASMPRTFGYDVPEYRALETARRVLRGPLNFLDTSAGYGDGESERRIGIVVRELGGLPAGFVLGTKVDPDFETGDFSGAAVIRSVEDSLRRLGLEHLQLLHFHDPERISFDEAMAPDGAVPALLRLQREGVVPHLGVAGGPIDLMRRYVATGAFQVVLTHNRYTLVDRSAEPLLEEASQAGVGVINAAVFGGGVLTGSSDRAHRKYAYRPASDDLLERIGRMERVCVEAGVPLRAAALQWSLRDRRISSTVVGMSRPERIDEMLELAAVPIPGALWSDLEALVPGPEGWLG